MNLTFSRSVYFIALLMYIFITVLYGVCVYESIKHSTGIPRIKWNSYNPKYFLVQFTVHGTLQNELWILKYLYLRVFSRYFGRHQAYTLYSLSFAQLIPRIYFMLTSNNLIKLFRNFSGIIILFYWKKNRLFW